jgi:hypothetical protein
MSTRDFSMTAGWLPRLLSPRNWFGWDQRRSWRTASKSSLASKGRMEPQRGLELTGGIRDATEFKVHHHEVRVCDRQLRIESPGSFIGGRTFLGFAARDRERRRFGLHDRVAERVFDPEKRIRAGTKRAVALAHSARRDPNLFALKVQVTTGVSEIPITVAV